jgi:TorA maturation chaperone TorD
MMLPNHKSDELTALAKRYSIYTLFKRYYQGEWRQGSEVMEAVQKYLAINQQVKSARDESSDDEVNYEYNRLFVGPAKLLAPPYESAYRNCLGLVMQGETLAVRNAYREAGIEVGDKNAIPDDHLGLEFEFICFLLAQAGQKLEAEDLVAANSYLTLYQNFLQEHIVSWVFQHCNDILQHGKTSLCRGVAVALVDFLQAEEARSSSKEGSG